MRQSKRAVPILIEGSRDLLEEMGIVKDLIFTHFIPTIKDAPIKDAPIKDAPNAAELITTQSYKMEAAAEVLELCTPKAPKPNPKLNWRSWSDAHQKLLCLVLRNPI